jgi:hypothetical protein
MLLGLLQIHSLSLPKENVEDQTIILNGNITTVIHHSFQRRSAMMRLTKGSSVLRLNTVGCVTSLATPSERHHLIQATVVKVAGQNGLTAYGSNV